MFFHSERHSPIERTRIAGSVRYTSKVGERWSVLTRIDNRVTIQGRRNGEPSTATIGIFEAGQMHTQTPIEVGIGRHVLHELLFVCDIHCVNPRVRIVLAEYRYADKRGKRPGRQYGVGYRIWVRRKRNFVGEYASSD